MAQFTDYISELKSPSLKYHEDGSLPSHQDIESYLSGVEQMRQEFLSVISEKDDNVIRAYLDEVEQADKIIDKRGFINMRDIVIASAMDSGLNGAPYFLIQKSIDSRLHSSALSTIAFFKSLLGEEVAAPKTIPELSTTVEKRIDTGWYSLDEVCEKYKLPKNSVKSRKWRLEVGFPTHQDGAYSKVRFNASEVEEWISKH